MRNVELSRAKWNGHEIAIWFAPDNGLRGSTQTEKSFFSFHLKTKTKDFNNLVNYDVLDDLQKGPEIKKRAADWSSRVRATEKDKRKETFCVAIQFTRMLIGDLIKLWASRWLQKKRTEKKRETVKHFPWPKPGTSLERATLASQLSANFNYTRFTQAHRNFHPKTGAMSIYTN